STLPACVLSIFSKYTRSPAGSTIATAMVHWFFFASATAAAATVFAWSAVMVGPYMFGCPCAAVRTGMSAPAARSAQTTIEMCFMVANYRVGGTQWAVAIAKSAAAAYGLPHTAY